MILRNSVIVAFWTAASRGLGFARDLLIANKLGAGTAADAFFIALMLPNLLRRLFGEGAFNVAFVPILARHRARDKEEALRFASAAFSWLLLVVAAAVIAGEIFMPVLVGVMASGWLDQPEKFALAVHLGRITFPYLGLITIAAFMGAMCNTYEDFSSFAMVPAFLNLSILLCLFALPAFGTHPAEAAAWAIPLGGIAQAVYMVWAVRRLGLRLTLGWLPKHGDLRKLLLRMGPAAMGVGVLQLSLVIDNEVASFLREGTIAYLQYANRFYQLPMSLIGIAVATVLLPHLSVLLGSNDKKGASTAFTNALGGCLALAFGSCVTLFILAPEMMMVLLQHGRFTEEAAHATAWAMMAYVSGLPAYILTKVTAPAFFAGEDPVSPVKAGACALLVNFVLNIAFVLGARALGLERIAFVGIALATALGGYTNAALQWYWLSRKGMLTLDQKALRRDIGKMLLVSAAMAAVLLAFKFGIPYHADWALMVKLVWLVTALGCGAMVFMLGVEASGLLNVRGMVRAGMRRRAKAG